MVFVEYVEHEAVEDKSGGNEEGRENHVLPPLGINGTEGESEGWSLEQAHEDKELGEAVGHDPPQGEIIDNVMCPASKRINAFAIVDEADGEINNEEGLEENGEAEPDWRFVVPGRDVPARAPESV